MNIPFVVGSIFTLIAAALLYRSVSRFRLAESSRDWPTSNGTLIKVSMWGKRNVNGQMVDADHIQVEYTYQVDGEKYQNNDIAFYTLMYPETIEFDAIHSTGSSVHVFYNPQQPSQSVLISGPRQEKPYSDLAIGALATLIGLGLSIAGWLGVAG